MPLIRPGCVNTVALESRTKAHSVIPHLSATSIAKDVGAETRLSVRTRDGGVDAIELTSAFGGGGHARAPGATVESPLEAARPKVLELAGQLIAAAPPR